MTNARIPNSTSVLQESSALPSPSRFGRRAFGPQRRMSQHDIACNIANSIITHRKLGEDRSVSDYTPDPETQALAEEMLESIVLAADAAMTMNPMDLW